MANNPKTVSLEDVSKVTMGKDQQRTLQYAMKHILSVGQKESVADRFSNVSTTSKMRFILTCFLICNMTLCNMTPSNSIKSLLSGGFQLDFFRSRRLINNKANGDKTIFVYTK